MAETKKQQASFNHIKLFWASSCLLILAKNL